MHARQAAMPPARTTTAFWCLEPRQLLVSSAFGARSRIV
jgi:hypothetical protein